MRAVSPQQRLQHLERIAWLLDSSVRVPGTQFRFGLDGLVGLVPGIGDLIGVVFSVYIMIQSARAGAPSSVLSRMGLNILLEAIVGLVPLFGDLFDIVFRANVRNVALLRDYQQQSGPVKQRSRGLLVSTVMVALAICIGVAILAGMLLQWLWTQITV